MLESGIPPSFERSVAFYRRYLGQKGNFFFFICNSVREREAGKQGKQRRAGWIRGGKAYEGSDFFNRKDCIAAEADRFTGASARSRLKPELAQTLADLGKRASDRIRALGSEGFVFVG